MSKMWCRACNAMVEVVIKRGVSAARVAASASVGAAMSGRSAKGKQGAFGRAVLGGLLGAATGLAAEAIVRKLVPAAQKLVCGSCGCEHLAEHSA